MHFSTLSATAVACFVYNAVANPIAEPLPVELIERQSGVGAGSCFGPIINIFTYPDEGCTNTIATAQVNLIKLAPIPTDPNKSYQSECYQVNVPSPDATAKSFFFTSDGFNTRNCYLNTYETDNCSSNKFRNQGLRFGFSRCNNEVVGSVSVYCNPSNSKRDLGDEGSDGGEDGPVLPWKEIE
ncbi:hypothetical protein Q7P37_010253 [Cladosporium fusiforme]